MVTHLKRIHKEKRINKKGELLGQVSQKLFANSNLSSNDYNKNR